MYTLISNMNQVISIKKILNIRGRSEEQMGMLKSEVEPKIQFAKLLVK